MYFSGLEDNEKLFGLVYGLGEVELLHNSFYAFQVHYTNGQTVPYTEDGIPGWGTLDVQTVFYPSDIDLTVIDISPVCSTDLLTPKEIIKLRKEGKLEVKCPSNVWVHLTGCDGRVVEDYLENSKLKMFRKAK